MRSVVDSDPELFGHVIFCHISFFQKFAPCCPTSPHIAAGKCIEFRNPTGYFMFATKQEGLPLTLDVTFKTLLASFDIIHFIR